MMFSGMRSIEITPRIQALLAAHLGDEAPSTDKIAVFETAAYSTRPLSKHGSMFNKAVTSRATLTAMADFLNAGNLVPLQIMHQTHDQLPVGRLFYAEVIDLDDASELRTLFYLNNSEDKLVNDIETSVVQAVSVGVLHEKLLCSECGWNYRGDDATAMNYWDQTCANDHVLGENGVHLNCIGLENWFETSLVGRGADRSAKIVSRARARLSEDQVEKLAASGLPLEGMTLIATHKVQGAPKVELKELVERLEAKAGELVTSQGTIAELTEKLAAANARIAELEASAEAPAVEDEEDTAGAVEGEALTAAETAKAEAESQRDAALAFLQEQTKKALIASGQTDPEAPATVEECIAALNDAKKNLVNLLADAGNSLAADSTEKPRASYGTNAFKTRK